MKTFKKIAFTALVVVSPACGQSLVEFGAPGSAGHANGAHSGKGGAAGSAGKSGSSGRAGGGRGGTGAAGTGDTGGESGDGRGGASAVGGNAGSVALGGTVGQSGEGGEGGLGGGSGTGGAAGESGMAGAGGENGALLVVTSTNPADDDLAVALNKTVGATFNETMTLVTMTGAFTLSGPGLTPIPGVVAVVGSMATFDPDSDLAPSTTFTATISATATALSGDALANDYVWTFTTGTQAAQVLPQAAVPLGSASNFAILASAAITDIPSSLITGDVGLTPDAGSFISGFSVPASCPEVIGVMYKVDASGPACAVVNTTLLDNAKIDAGIAFINARAVVRGTPQAIAGDLNGLTLYPGLYESGSTIEISPGGFLYLDAQGDSSAVFIIRSANSITTESTSEVVLTKGARANNVYWTAGTAVTLGTSSIMKGTLLAGTAISLLTSANLEGRALNQGTLAEAITLDKNVITVPSP